MFVKLNSRQNSLSTETHLALMVNWDTVINWSKPLAPGIVLAAGYLSLKVLWIDKLSGDGQFF